MTTAGKIVSEPLAKAQCMSCGILKRVEIRQLGETDFYVNQYSFYERPGAATFDAPRYAEMAKWISDAISPFSPKTAFDAGCGRGWMMQALSKYFPSTSFFGIEPSKQESENARNCGLNVITGKVHAGLQINSSYDLVYSTNVVEHTTDPIDFLTTLRRLTSDGGFVAILCPDSSEPSAEFMFSDQNYSFTPSHLASLALRAGLSMVSSSNRPNVPSLRDKQVVIFRRTENVTRSPLPVKNDVPLPTLLASRSQYILSYVACDNHLVSALRTTQRTINFGTSTWSMLLAAYCPEYWERVTFCTIDNGSGTFLGKRVFDVNSITFEDGDALVLGINPVTQRDFADRLAVKTATPCITWSQIVAR